MIRKTQFLLALAAVTLSSCNHSLPASGFLGKDATRLKPDKGLPFQQSWRNPAANFQKYNSIAVIPMTIDRVNPLGHGLAAASVRNFGETHDRDCKKLAAYATSEFRDEINASGTKQAFITRRHPQAKGMLLLETALIEAVPGRPSAQILNFFIPFSALLNRPSVAIEGRVRDAASGETLFAFSDREVPELSLFDTRKFTYYATQERDVDRWAVQLRQLIEGNRRKLKKDPFFIQPINW